MDPLSDWLNDELERQEIAQSEDGRAPRPRRPSDPEFEELVRFASRLQKAPPLQVDRTFARRLEGRVLARNAALHRSRPAPRRWSWHFPRLVRAHPVLGVALSLCLLVILLGAGVLAVAAQITNPNNPLYAIKRWEGQGGASPTSSQANQAELDLQSARNSLNTLANLADPAHAGAYRHALSDFDQKLSTAAQAVNALPAGPGLCKSRIRHGAWRLKVAARGAAAPQSPPSRAKFAPVRPSLRRQASRRSLQARPSAASRVTFT